MNEIEVSKHLFALTKVYREASVDHKNGREWTA
jgi:hypothetical protein